MGGCDARQLSVMSYAWRLMHDALPSHGDFRRVAFVPCVSFPREGSALSECTPVCVRFALYRSRAVPLCTYMYLVYDLV